MSHKYHKDGTLPENGEVWVFGSNEMGIHGAGAARVAFQRYGMEMGVWLGWSRNYKSFAIPTKGKLLETLPMNIIRDYVQVFVDHTKLLDFDDKKFFVTRVGCGLAGLKDEQVAPLFKDAVNCSFAESWRPYLEDSTNN